MVACRTLTPCSDGVSARFQPWDAPIRTAQTEADCKGRLDSRALTEPWRIRRCRITGQPRRPGRAFCAVIGHEPDTDERMGMHAGPYDLAAGKRISFWILSHKVIGRAAGFGEHLRAAAITCGSSPIVYSDASPAADYT